MPSSDEYHLEEPSRVIRVERPLWVTVAQHGGVAELEAKLTHVVPPFQPLAVEVELHGIWRRREHNDQPDGDRAVRRPQRRHRLSVIRDVVEGQLAVDGAAVAELGKLDVHVQRRKVVALMADQLRVGAEPERAEVGVAQLDQQHELFVRAVCERRHERRRREGHGTSSSEIPTVNQRFGERCRPTGDVGRWRYCGGAVKR